MAVPENSVAQTLTDAAKDGITELIAGYVIDGLQDSVWAATDLPGFIADDGPISLPNQPLRQITRLACKSYARGGGPQNLPGFDAIWSGICTPYLDSIGESPEPGNGIAPPFSGGQCPGVTYNVSVTGTVPPNAPQTFEANLVGPLRWNQDLPPVPPDPGCGPGSAWKRYTIAGQGSGTIISWVGCDATLTVNYVNPLYGGANDCGDPPPLYDPPKVKPDLPAVPKTPIDLPGIGPVGVNINFNPDGTLNVELPDVGVEVDVPINIGGGDGGDGAGGAAGPPPGDVGEPGSPEVVGPGGDAEGEAPPGKVLTGLRVQITAFPPSRNKYTDEVYRGAYYAYMGVPGLLDLDFGGAMVRADQFLLAEKDNLTAWRISANTGYELITTPYYREAEV